MGQQFDEIKAFIERIKRVVRVADLNTIADEAISALGFDFFAIGHHVDLTAPPDNAVLLIRYPTGWYGRFLDEQYYIDDPILMTAQRSASAFIWEDIPRKVTLSGRQKNILEQAPREGMGAGFTVPIHVPGEFSGSCHFVVRPGRDLPEESLPLAQFIGSFLFEAARRVRKAEMSARGTVAQGAGLSPRQRDCVVLVARGLSDKEISRLLSIRPDTAHEYIEEAKQRYGVKTRHQLIVHALYDGELAFADALGVAPPLTRGYRA